MFDTKEQPTGAELRAFRLRIIIHGEPCTQEQLADFIGTLAQNIKHYEVEKNGKLMPCHLWTITRIMFDALALAEFIKIRPKRD